MTISSREIDVASNRSSQKWTRREKIGRVLWSLTFPLFRFSPRLMWGWRRQILRVFGATVGSDVHVHPTVKIEIPWNLSLGQGSAVGERAILYALGSIAVGPRVTISQGAHLCAGTHDWRDPCMPLLKLPISIGSDAWICADAFIGPNVQVGEGAVVGARAVVMKNVERLSIVSGNPAREIKKRVFIK